MLGYCVVLITVPPDRADQLAHLIVEKKLGACVNVVPEVRSLYWWKGNMEKDRESLLVVKTSFSLFPQLLKEVKENHPYTVPEIIALPIVAGNPDYLNWIDESLR
ncbi:CutA1 divalent ion tolerance protein [Thermocrinis albus DSM 14484]|uniref:CutA1 divalent ion tolerance protein n=1 Tax=Thermocrinis albus (strain DSM 14484 / JCM 11386 / HI 11/12) TaxID=638303 RepID=D3SL89_THEAH|nr:divalent-cation tolerance protein CutA [Thermocrinis albus]ADC89519.1 CutA1 divalent ion tolerance protein [Thermocrinis albus DSM 14484]